MKKSDDDGALFTAPGQPPMAPGPVYQGVCRQIRSLLEVGTIDRDRDAGAIAAARSAGRSIDSAAGHNPRGYVASGMQLAALHQSLLAWLELLSPNVAEADEFAELVEQMQRIPGGHAPASHPEI